MNTTTRDQRRFEQALNQEIADIFIRANLLGIANLSADAREALTEFLTDPNFSQDPEQDRKAAEIIAAELIKPGRPVGQCAPIELKRVTDILLSNDINRGKIISLYRAATDYKPTDDAPNCDPEQDFTPGWERDRDAAAGRGR